MKMTPNRSKPWAIVHAFRPKMHVFLKWGKIDTISKGVKMTLKSIKTMGY
jgi:hypothetical protein